jgi:phospholipid-binding lipoprotein MlaA
MKKGFLLSLLVCLSLTGCQHHCANPADPFEPINRNIYKMNMAFDATFLKPPADLYIWLIPVQIRAGINNVYDNIATLPTIANDILQLQTGHTIHDIGRFSLNSTLGLGGIGDVATQLGVPRHHNDFGLTVAHWGNSYSPYVMIPFLGPCTLRDSFSLLVDYTFFTPYPFIPNPMLYRVLGLRYVDLRSQMADNLELLKNAIDPYVMMRDAYLSRRLNQISQNQKGTVNLDEDDSTSLYVEDSD